MAGVPSRGRSKAVERSDSKKSFVFGSSTPRDLSYMHTVPATLRTYDSKVKPPPRAKEQTLAHYMRQARSVSRMQSGSREGSSDRVPRATFAFGSSTPRLLSHLYTVNYADAKINPQVGRRSYTTPTLPVSRSKTVPAPVKVQITRNIKIIRKTPGTEQKKVTTTTTTTRQEISANHQPKEGSEEFMNSVKEKLEAEKDSQKDKTKPVKKVAPKKKESKAEKAIEEETPKEPEVGKIESPKEAEKSIPVETTGSGNLDEKVSPMDKPESKLKTTDETQLLEASVAEDEAKLLSVEAAPAQNIVPEEVSEHSGTTKLIRVESLTDSKTVQVLDEVPPEQMIQSFHMGSMEQENIKETFSIISKEDHPEMDEKETDSKERKIETKQEVSGNLGIEEREPSPFMEHRNNTTPIAISSDPEVSLSQSSPPPTPTKSTADDAQPTDINKISTPPGEATEQKNNAEHGSKSPEQEVKDRLEKPEDAHPDSDSDQHRFPIPSESVPESMQHLQQSDIAAPEKPPHRLIQEPPEAQAGTGHQIIYNYSYEYRSGTPGSQESSHMDVEGNYQPEREGSPNEEERKKPGDSVEGISAL